MHRKQYPPLLLFLAFMLLFFAARAHIGRGQEPEPPARNQEREAPERETVVLRRETLEPGVVNVLIEIPPAADTYIASGAPNRTFSEDPLFIGYNVSEGYAAQRSLIRFDVAPQIPDTARVDSATVRLYLSYSNPGSDEPMPSALYNLLSPWEESEATWNNRPVRGPKYDETFVGSANGWYEWDVTDLVGAWENGVLANYGVEIVGDEAVQMRERAFYSRETATAFYPQLQVEYTDVGDADPPNITVNPLPATSPRTFPVSWSGSDAGGSGIAYYDVQYRVDGGAWTEWLSQVNYTGADFTGQSDHIYDFRARGVDLAGNVEAFGEAEATTTVDTTPPQTTMEPLPTVIRNNTFAVAWNGSSAGASIAHYDVRYRFNWGPWIAWQQQTVATSASFTAPEDGLYEFEARAVDTAGNIEPFSNQPEAATIVDVEEPFVVPRLYLPMIFNLTETE